MNPTDPLILPSFTSNTITSNNNMDNGTPEIIFVVGGPASGKTNQCNQLAEKYGFEHISIKELLPAETSSKELLVQLQQQMQQKGWGNKKYLIEGFPRNEEDFECYNTDLKSKTKNLGLLFLDVDPSIMTQRFLFSSAQNPNDEILLKKRLTVYENDTMPVIYKLMMGVNDVVFRVDAGKPKDDVFNAITVQVDNMIAGNAPHIDFSGDDFGKSDITNTMNNSNKV